MVKVVYCLIALFLLSLGFFKSSLNESNENTSLPDVNKVIVLNKIEDNNSNEKIELPQSSKAKTLNEYQSSDGIMEEKMRKTTFSFSPQYKTLSPRLSKEEIAIAPIVARFPMNVNNQDIEVVVVEKDGKTYDASDGVRIYMPESLKFHSEVLDFLYK